MQIAVSLDYNTITFTHSVLQIADIDSITLEYTRNCGTISDAIDLTANIPDIDDATTSLTIPIADIDSTLTVFNDGVYYFKLTVVGPDVEGEPGSYVLTGCIYIGTTSRCKAVCLYSTGDNELIRYIIKALDIVNDCDDCDCSTQCDLYDYLISLLTSTSTTSTNVYNSCGCD